MENDPLMRPEFRPPIREMRGKIGSSLTDQEYKRLVDVVARELDQIEAERNGKQSVVKDPAPERSKKDPITIDAKGKELVKRELIRMSTEEIADRCRGDFDGFHKAFRTKKLEISGKVSYVGKRFLHIKDDSCEVRFYFKDYYGAKSSWEGKQATLWGVLGDATRNYGHGPQSTIDMSECQLVSVE